MGAATEALSAALERRPDHGQALYARSRAYIQAQDLLSAAADAERLLRLVPDDPYFLELSIEIKGLLGYFEEIVPLCDKVLEVDPESLHIYATRGHAYLNLGKYDEAVRDFQKMLDEGWENEYNYTNLGLAWSKKGDFQKALECLDAAIAQNPRHAAAHNHRGFALFRLGEADAGMQEINLALSLDPESPYAYKNRAIILL